MPLRWPVAVLLLALVPRAVTAQSGASALVPVAPVLLEQAEGERIACRRQRVEEQASLRYGGRPFDFALEGSLPIRWRVTLLDTRRVVTLGLLRNYVPREILVDAGREAGTAGLHESVRARFLPDGSLQDGERTTMARRRGPPATSPLDSTDIPRLYALARELAFRCDRRFFDPMPEGSVLGQIPPG